MGARPTCANLVQRGRSGDTDGTVAATVHRPSAGSGGGSGGSGGGSGIEVGAVRRGGHGGGSSGGSGGSGRRDDVAVRGEPVGDASRGGGGGVRPAKKTGDTRIATRKTETVHCCQVLDGGYAFEP